jgi:VanZ family protein
VEPAVETAEGGGSASSGFLYRLMDRPRWVRLWTLLGFWAAMFALTHWPELDDLLPDADWLPMSDKIIHFTMFAGWMTAWWWLLSASRPRVGGVLLAKVLAGGACYAAFDELTQALVARDPDLSDWLADLAGMSAALVVLLYARRRRTAAESA